MITRNIPLRHELKYHITPAELSVLRSVSRFVACYTYCGNTCAAVNTVRKTDNV